MNNKKLVVLALTVLIIMLNISASFATTYNQDDSTDFMTFWANDPFLVPIIIQIEFEFSVEATGDIVIHWQEYYARVINGRNTAFNQSFIFNNTTVRKNSTILKTYNPSDFKNVSVIYDPRDIVKAQKCSVGTGLSSPTSIRTSYSWSSKECTPGIVPLTTTINF